MLSKLLKYDFKFVYKNLIVFYIIAAVSATLAYIVPKINDAPFFQIVGTICQNVTFSMIITVFINGFMRLWVNFQQKTYGDPAYLAHTLPIKRSTLYSSKVIMAAIVNITNLIASVAVFIVAYGFIDDLSLIADKVTPLIGSTGLATWQALALVGFTLYVECLLISLIGYLVTITAYNSGVKHNFRALVVAIIGYSVPQILIVLFIFIAAQFDSNIMVLFTGGQLDNLIAPVLISIAINLFCIAGYYSISSHVLRRGVNVI